MLSLIRITPATFEELKREILEIEKASFPSPWSEAAFREETKNPVSSFWGLVLDRTLGGYICFWTVSGEIHLMNIAVRPSQRRKGMGYHLMKGMIESGAAQGVRVIWLEVRPSNTAATKLYSALGFREVARRPRYYVDTKEDAVIMALEFPNNHSRSHGPDARGQETWASRGSGSLL